MNLTPGQSEVMTSPLEKFLMATAFDNDPFPDHGDDVGILDCGEAVGDDDGGPICHRVVQSLLNHLRNTFLKDKSTSLFVIKCHFHSDHISRAC